MTRILRDRSEFTRTCALALGALVVSAVTAAAPASAADSSAPVGLIAATTAPGISTHTDIVLSNVGPATVPAETRIDASVTRGGEPVVVGQVQFSINGKQFGSAVPVQDGMASLSVIQGVPGTYTISARYAGYADDALNLDPSASGKAVFEVVPAGTGCVGGTTCDGTPVWGSDDDDDEPSGVIVISTPYTESSPLVLPPLTLQRSATCIQDPLEYATDAPFSGISISDTREGRRPWTASVQSEDLLLDGQTATSASNQQRIDGQNVGLTHLALTSTSAAPQTISAPRTAGTGNLALPINFTIFDNPSAEHVQGNAVGTLGLGGSPKRVIHANRGFGTSMFVGTLTITAPTNTVQGTYLGKLTFTVLGS